ncbi:MAG: hydroxypyruvate isomerase [Leptolyngbya sp. PLA1]|nr:hydroxypyruvate isomerase [Leptolyngbya sp. PLA1]
MPTPPSRRRNEPVSRSAAKLRRRDVLAGAVGLAASAVSAAATQPGLSEPLNPAKPAPGDIVGTIVRKGRIRHSVCRWCYGGIKLNDLCARAAEMGISSVELLGPDEWPVAAAHGLTCAVATNVPSNPIPRGFNRAEHHDTIIRDLEQRLPLVAQAGIPSQIVFSGNRAGLSDADGLRACAAGLKRITPLAEKLGVTLVMELLNSRVDHKDYQCDRTPWGVELVNQVGSERFKLLYDIYHMQIMEGDVIRTIRDHHRAIGHYHTGGNPGRREIDETQELYYPAICRAIAGTGYTGFVGQEFIPSKDPIASLQRAIDLCDV